jgi:hypothetical protein
MNSNKIIKIVPYFGKLPNFWPIYLKSLEKQSQHLDLLFVTDIVLKQEDLPANVKVLKCSMDEYFETIEQKINVKMEHRNPYKTCDLKPMLGFLFSEHIKSYAYWAFGDIDLIYGNLHRYIRGPIAEGYDVITFREDWASGVLTIIKNTPENNALFKDSPDYKMVLESNKNYAFDECAVKYSLLREGYTVEEAYNAHLPGDIVCYTTVINRAAQKNKIKLFMRYYIKESLPFNEILKYENGKIIGGGDQEYALYHLVYHKKFAKNIIPQWSTIPDSYYITTTGLYSPIQFRWYHITKIIRTMYGFFVDRKKWAKDMLNYRLGLTKK